MKKMLGFSLKQGYVNRITTMLGHDTSRKKETHLTGFYSGKPGKNMRESKLGFLLQLVL